MYTGHPTNFTTTATQKPQKQDPKEEVFCFTKDADPLSADLNPIPPFITIIECGSSQYCEPIFEHIPEIGYLKLFIISYLPKS